jgi:hypothetical protein
VPLTTDLMESTYLPFYLTISSDNEHQNGSFAAEPIRIISKPTRKKNVAKSENRIYSGSFVSLFNRIASQTTSTNYLTASESNIYLSSQHWDPVCRLMFAKFMTYFFSL